MLIMALFLFNLVSFASLMPLYGQWNNFLGAFNRFALLVCSYHLIAFTEYVDTK